MKPKKKRKPADVSEFKFATPEDVHARLYQRYTICGDDSGHEYFIPVEEVKAFYTWVEAGPYWDGYEGPEFDDKRIDGTFTFTDPRCE
jgi:hypothetical protein